MNIKFTDLVFDLLVEEVVSKRIVSAMIKKWFGENPTTENISLSEDLLTKFFSIKQRLSLTTPAVKRFINRFNRPSSSEKFDTRNPINDVTFYTLNQIKFIVGEFTDIVPNINVEDNGFPPNLQGKDIKPSDEVNESSKNLWYTNNQYTIVNEDGFRVYKIPNQKTSINFGYYQSYINNKSPFTDQSKTHMNWCTARFKVSENLWSSYRNRRTFYFVIDESKNPEVQPDVNISQYYLSALQFSTDSQTNYRITTILNDGSDPIIQKNELFSLYPKLQNHIDKILPVEFDARLEAGENTDIVNLINEVEGNPYEFSAQGFRDMKSYIDRGKIISRGKSWESMDESLKKTYIDITERAYVKERFGSVELLDLIKSKKSEQTSLTRRLEILNLTFSYLITEVYLKNFDFQRPTIKNNNVALLRDNTSNKFGLFNYEKTEWVKFNGIEYNNRYLEPKAKLFMGEDDTTYIVEGFHLIGGESNESFYSVTEYTGENLKKNTPCNFFSRERWEKSINDLRIIEIDSNLGSFSDKEIPDESDLQEKK